MTPESASARDVALRLIASQTTADASGESLSRERGALHQAIAELSRWVGPDGCRALLTRALNRAVQQHPVLGNVQVVSHSAPVLTGLDESVEASSVEAVGAGLTSTLVHLFDLLGRVIGDELTLKLTEQITAGQASSAEQGEEVEEEGSRNF